MPDTLSPAPPNTLTAKGSQRAEDILSTALQILAQEGQAGLTLEGVAKRVGIRKGNLQYYYPTRADLLRAALAAQIERHKQDWLAVHDRPAKHARDRLCKMVDFELATNRDQSFIAQVREKWSLAERDEGARRLANDWNVWVSDRYAAIISEVRPELDKATCRQTAMMVYALLVGSTPFYAEGWGPCPAAAGI